MSDNTYIFDGTTTSYLKDETVTPVILDDIVQQTWVIRVKRTQNDVGHGFVGSYLSTGRLKLEIRDTNLASGSLRDTGVSSFVGVTVALDGGWYTYSMVYGGATIDLWEDKVQVASTADPDFTARSSGRILMIGGSDVHEAVDFGLLVGEISDVQFYNRALTQIEIEALVDDLTDLPTDNATSLVANFAGNKTETTWTSEVGGYAVENQGAVVLNDPPTTASFKTTWTDSVSAGIIGHKIYRDDVEIADVGMGVEVYYDATAEIGTTYKYEVQAYSATDETTTETVGVNVKSITVVAAPTNINVVEI